MTLNCSIERTATGKPASAAHVKRYVDNEDLSMTGTDGMDDYLRMLRMVESWRRIEEQQRPLRELAEASRAYEPIRAYLEQERRVHGSTTVRRMVEDIERLRNALAHQVPPADSVPERLWAQYRSMLEISTRPYPDVQLGISGAELEFLRSYEQLNRALADAAFAADVELDDGDGVSEPEEHRDVESQLIEVVPADTLDALRRVAFAPFSLVAAAVARPETLWEVTPRTFEQFIAELVSRLGIEDVILTPEKSDGGRDVIGTKRVLGFTLIFAFECKRYQPDRPVSVEYARALLGTITHGEFRADRGVLVTTSRFTDPARHFIVTSPQLEGVDFNGIVGWLREYATRSRIRPS